VQFVTFRSTDGPFGTTKSETAVFTLKLAETDCEQKRVTHNNTTIVPDDLSASIVTGPLK